MLLACLSFVSAVLANTISAAHSDLAVAWYANALGMLVLASRPRREWPLLTGVALAASLASNLLAGIPMKTSLAFLLGNGLEIIVGATVLRAGHGYRLAASDPVRMGWALLGAALLTPAIGAIGADLAMSAMGITASLSVWPKWFAGTAVGAMAVLPFGLTVYADGMSRVWRDLRRPGVLLAVAVSVAAAWYAPTHLEFPFVYVALPLVLSAGVAGAAGVPLAAMLTTVVLGTLIARGVLRPSSSDGFLGYLNLYGAMILAVFPAVLLSASARHARAGVQQLAANERRYRDLYENTPVMMLSVDRKNRIRDASRQWLERTGYDKAEIIGRDADMFLDPEGVERRRAATSRMLSTGLPARNVELDVVARDGERFAVLLSSVFETDAAGQAIGAFAMAIDVSERNRLSSELAAGRNLYEVTLDAIGDGVISTDARTRVLYLNPVAETMLGVSLGAVIGRPLADVLSLTDPSSGEAIEELVPANGRQVDRTVVLHGGGHEYPIRNSVTPIRDDNGSARGAVLVLQDLTEAHSLAERMSHLAHHDALTGLPNRMMLQGRMEEACRSHRESGRNFAVLFMDLDHFKNINDSLGHESGDAVLRRVAGSLRSLVRSTDTVCRFGGDEFVLLVERITGAEEVASLAGRIFDEVAGQLRLGTAEVAVNLSVGIAMFPSDGSDVATLLKHADAAMYRAKREGRKRYRFYSESIDVLASNWLNIESDIRRGIAAGEFFPHYQPIIDVHSGRVVSLEALARWQPANGPLRMPSSFIQIAEESGLVAGIGEAILCQACRDLAAWRARGHDLRRVSVNVSPLQFLDDRFANTVRHVLAENGLKGSDLGLEITESSLIEAPDAAIRFITEMRGQGVRIAIDDFGTGYSSLGYLRRYPVDTMKIDRSFLQDITVTQAQERIVEAVIRLAKGLGLGVVAEGVEEVDQAALLARLGCDRLQGFLFSRPLPAAEVEAHFGRRDMLRFDPPRFGGAPPDAAVLAETDDTLARG
ncbi:MAG: EAL domain-containing protein [Burkholderiaceae bacterium]